MKIHNEKIDYENPLLSLKVFKMARGPHSDAAYTWHYHKEVEFLAVHHGSMEVHIEEDVFEIKAGDVIMIGPSQLHRDRNQEQLEYTVLQFDVHPYFEQSTMAYLRFFIDDNMPLSKMNSMFRAEHVRRSVYQCISEIYEEALTKTPGYEIAVNLLIKKILLTLLRSEEGLKLSSKPNPELLRLRPVLDYIDEHVDDKISVEEASRIANMSYYYFVKFFRKTMGMSFTEFVNYKKIKKPNVFSSPKT